MYILKMSYSNPPFWHAGYYITGQGPRYLAFSPNQRDARRFGSHEAAFRFIHHQGQLNREASGTVREFFQEMQFPRIVRLRCRNQP